MTDESWVKLRMACQVLMPWPMLIALHSTPFSQSPDCHPFSCFGYARAYREPNIGLAECFPGRRHYSPSLEPERSPPRAHPAHRLPDAASIAFTSAAAACGIASHVGELRVERCLERRPAHSAFTKPS